MAYFDASHQVEDNRVIGLVCRRCGVVPTTPEQRRVAPCKQATRNVFGVVVA